MTNLRNISKLQKETLAKVVTAAMKIDGEDMSVPSSMIEGYLSSINVIPEDEEWDEFTDYINSESFCKSSSVTLRLINKFFEEQENKSEADFSSFFDNATSTWICKPKASKQKEVA